MKIKNESGEYDFRDTADFLQSPVDIQPLMKNQDKSDSELFKRELRAKAKAAIIKQKQAELEYKEAKSNSRKKRKIEIFNPYFIQFEVTGTYTFKDLEGINSYSELTVKNLGGLTKSPVTGDFHLKNTYFKIGTIITFELADVKKP